jgi:transcription termination/antitermination protein NusG
MSNDDFKWYVIRCFSGHEKKVREFLNTEMTEMGLEDKINEILIPTETVVEIRSGKKRTREKNLYPGYIIISAIYDDSVNNLISNAPSVIGFLKTDKDSKKPAPLKKEEVDSILGHVNFHKEVAAAGGNVKIPYKIGDIIKVTDGPFKDFDGTVEEIYPDKLKLRVLVSIFGRKTPVEVDVNQVENVD